MQEQWAARPKGPLLWFHALTLGECCRAAAAAALALMPHQFLGCDWRKEAPCHSETLTVKGRAAAQDTILDALGTSQLRSYMTSLQLASLVVDL